jgi:hypothetical protein
VRAEAEFSLVKGLDDPDFESQQEQKDVILSKSSGQSLGPTHSLLCNGYQKLIHQK